MCDAVGWSYCALMRVHLRDPVMSCKCNAHTATNSVTARAILSRSLCYILYWGLSCCVCVCGSPLNFGWAYYKFDSCLGAYFPLYTDKCFQQPPPPPPLALYIRIHVKLQIVIYTNARYCITSDNLFNGLCACVRNAV